MNLTARHYQWAGAMLCVFLAAQVYQALCVMFWLPQAESAAGDFAVRLGWLDRARALAVLCGVVALAVPFAVVALDRFSRAPVASVLGFTFSMLFIFFEMLQRGLDFAMVSLQWAGEFAAATSDIRELLLQRHEIWGSATGAMYLPLLLSGLIAWTCFAIATWNAGMGWLRLASLAFALNALRTLGRLLGSYTGVEWVGFMNNFAVYLVLVFLINGLLAVWMFMKGRH